MCSGMSQHCLEMASAYAVERGGDLFVSIHANSVPSASSARAIPLHARAAARSMSRAIRPSSSTSIVSPPSMSLCIAKPAVTTVSLPPASQVPASTVRSM